MVEMHSKNHLSQKGRENFDFLVEFRIKRKRKMGKGGWQVRQGSVEIFAKGEVCESGRQRFDRMGERISKGEVSERRWKVLQRLVEFGAKSKMG